MVKGSFYASLGRSIPSLLIAAGLAWASPASAVVTQPNATMDPVPVPVNTNEINVVTSRGFPADAVTLEGLFKYRGEMLNPQADAHTTPGVFSPLCGFTGQFVLSGGSCKLSFGWYNATVPPTKPLDSEIYELVPPAIQNTPPLNCVASDFCPLATTMTTQPQYTWSQATFSADSIKSDSRYKGGLVGFALVGGGTASQCRDTKYSEAELNTICTNCTPNAPWVTTLIYQSTATPDAFYIAFEDLPLSPTDWKQYGCDGDFNDFVYFITGLTCDGGGQPCDTGRQGACSVGRTDCSVNGVPGTCHPLVQPGAELCDNIDNDCNGMVDDGDLCGAGQVCDKGSCVSTCSGQEFVCQAGTVCDSGGFCIDPACKGIACPADQACRAGKCVGACDGVVCPTNQQCQLGRCVDLCAGVTCPTGSYCDHGLCLNNCPCRACPAGQTCSTDGHCLDSSCTGVTCPAGQVCSAGACIDPCANVVCPGGATCTNGVCGDPMGQGASSTAAGVTTGILVGANTVAAATVGIGAGGASTAAGSGTSNGGAGVTPSKPSAAAPGCACRIGEKSDPTGGAEATLMGLMLALALRRRRGRAAA